MPGSWWVTRVGVHRRLTLARPELIFPVKAALLGGFSFVFSVSVATLIDSQLQDRLPKLGAFHPTFGIWIFAFGIPVFILIYWINRDKTPKASIKGVLTSVVLAGGGILSSFSFGPVLRLGVLAASLSYSLLMGFIVLVGNYPFEKEEILNAHTDRSVKIATLTLEYETWFRILVLLVTIIIILASVSLFRAFEISKAIFGGDVAAASLVNVGINVQ